MRRITLIIITTSALWVASCGGDPAAPPPAGGGTGGGSGGTGGSGQVDAGSGGGGAAGGGSSGSSGAPLDAGSTDTGGPEGTGAEAGALVLTSTAFVEGATIPAAHTCAGGDVSPPLSWTPGPAGTMSYAIILTDRNNNLIHSIIYDIPANVTSLPMNIEKVANPTTPAGAKQIRNYFGMVYGYLGPCPGRTAHTYEFMLYAIDVAALPVATTALSATVSPVILMHDLAMAPLTGSAATVP